MGNLEKWMARLRKHEGAVDLSENIYNDVLRTPMPSVNFIFGRTWGLPRGYTMALWGPQKGGKSMLTRLIIKQLHQDDPDAIAVVYDTEMRQNAQATRADLKRWGIDPERYVAYNRNDPEGIFDHIETELPALIQDGAKIKLVVIDSMSDIRGRRGMNADSVGAMQIGDQALTIKDGLQRILGIQRQCKFALIGVCQVTAEMDPLEIKRNNKWKMGAANAFKHYSEYFVFVDKDETADARKDLLGNEFKNEDLKDTQGRAEKTAHKIRVTMKDSSMGPKGRVGEFTLDQHGLPINMHEEIFLLGINRGVIERPNNLTYVFKDKQWTGKPAMLKALETDQQLRDAVVQELMKPDADEVADPG